jgi:hypothetical protein
MAGGWSSDEGEDPYYGSEYEYSENERQEKRADKAVRTETVLHDLAAHFKLPELHEALREQHGLVNARMSLYDPFIEMDYSATPLTYAVKELGSKKRQKVSERGISRRRHKRWMRGSNCLLHRTCVWLVACAVSSS